VPKFLNNVDLNNNQLMNARVHNLASDPGSPGIGLIWFHTTAGADTQGRLKVKLQTRTLILDDQYVGSVGAGTGVVIGGTALAPVVNVQDASGSVPGLLAAADYTLLHTATDLATNSALVQRDDTGKAAFSMVSITNAPTTASDAVNKAYADSIAAGFDPKGSCVLATTGALPACSYANGTAGVGATLTGSANGALTTTLIDGTSVYTLQVGDRILVKNQVAGLQNGIYTVTALGNASAPWVLTRATDFNTATTGPGLVSPGSFLFIENGANATTQWIMNTTNPITIGTTALVFTQFGAGSTYTNGNGLSLAGQTFSVNLTGTNTLEFNSTALRLKSSATANQVLLSGGTGVEPTYGALPLGNTSAVTGTLGKANGGFGMDISTGQAQNQFWASPNGGSGALALRAIVAADLPTSGIGAGGTYTKLTIDTYGRATGFSSLLAADIPALDFAKITTGIVPSTQGGTGYNLTHVKYTPSAQRLAARVVVTSNMASLSSPGATLDGQAMSVGDRVLLTGQTTQSQNGLWVWQGASALMTRPEDFAAASATMAYYGMEVSVLQGTVGAGTTYWLATSGAITIDTTGLTFTQLLTPAAALTGLVPLVNGGTNASTAAGARTNLGAMGRYTVAVGNGALTTIVVNHALGNVNVNVSVYEPGASNAQVYPDVQFTDANNVTLVFATAPTASQYNVVVEG
jgi:hypothetical protein